MTTLRNTQDIERRRYAALSAWLIVSMFASDHSQATPEDLLQVQLVVSPEFTG